MAGLMPSKSSVELGGWGRSGGGLLRSASEVIVSRGFKPSDTRNPNTTRFLTQLSHRMWGRALEASGHKLTIDDGQKKTIDLEKLFTPAPDTDLLNLQKSRKVFASSSFYAPNHPTVEEQVELARRISHSLSDINNRESKGQSMYVNRKKRSVKWVHEGEGKATESYSENTFQENITSSFKESKPVLKLVMNPRGQIQDLTTLRKQGFAVEPALSPDICLDLVRDLNAPKGKGAELFAKRRKKSEKWVVDENNVKTATGTGYQPVGAAGGAVNKLPPISYLKDATQRVENVQKMNQIQERFAQPRLKMVKSPWEAALEGSVEGAFQEVTAPRGVVLAPTPTTLRKLATPPPAHQASTPAPAPNQDLYKPKAPRAWNPLHPAPTCKTFSEEECREVVREAAGVVEGGGKAAPLISSYTGQNNFNTAPRGWQPTMAFYRPVTFSTPATAYTDF